MRGPRHKDAARTVRLALARRVIHARQCSLCLHLLFLRRAKRKRAIICFAEAFGVYPKGVVEPRAVVFPGNGCRQLDQLRLGEVFCEAREELLGHIYRSLGHMVRIFQDKPLGWREQRARLVARARLELLSGNAGLSADRRPDVDSKRAANKSRGPQLGQIFERSLHQATGEESLFHLSVSPENPGVMGSNLNGHHDLSQLPLGKPIEKPNQKPTE